MIHYASFIRRVWAFTLTLTVGLLVLGTLCLLMDLSKVWPAFAFWLVLHHIGLVVEGGTIGHRLAGLRVVRSDGERLGVIHAVVRVLMKWFVSLPPLGLGFLWMLDQPYRQTWHDIGSGSVVVRETEVYNTLTPDWADNPPWRSSKATNS